MKYKFKIRTQRNDQLKNLAMKYVEFFKYKLTLYVLFLWFVVERHGERKKVERERHRPWPRGERGEGNAGRKGMQREGEQEGKREARGKQE